MSQATAWCLTVGVVGLGCASTVTVFTYASALRGIERFSVMCVLVVGFLTMWTDQILPLIARIWGAVP